MLSTVQQSKQLHQRTPRISLQSPAASSPSLATPSTNPASRTQEKRVWLKEDWILALVVTLVLLLVFGAVLFAVFSSRGQPSNVSFRVPDAAHRSLKKRLDKAAETRFPEPAAKVRTKDSRSRTRSLRRVNRISPEELLEEIQGELSEETQEIL